MAGEMVRFGSQRLAGVDGSLRWYQRLQYA